MSGYRTRWFAGCIAILLLATGCFQQAGGALPATAPAQALPTFTPIPSDTPSPTPTPVPTQTPVVEPAETLPATGGTTDTVGDGTTKEGTGGALVATPDEDVGIVQPLGQPTEVAFVQQDPLALTATAIVQRATQTAEFNMTATALAAGIGFATETPTPLPALATETPVVAAPVVPGADCIHEVRAEDRNLYRISLRYGVTVNEIARASGIVNPDLITIGQRLTIPGCGTTGAVPPATSTPRASATDGTTPGAGTAPTAGGQVYVVQQGDTLYAISLRFGVPINSIAAANGITNTNLIYINQELVIPPS